MIVHQPFSYQIGSFTFTGFGVAVFCGFWIAQIIAQRELLRRGHDASFIGDCVLAAVVGSLVGAKLYYVILVHDINALWSRGGFVFWGGLMGGIAGVLLLIAVRKLPIWRIAEVAGLGLPAAYSVGRTGCWAVGDDYGRMWVSRFAVSFPNGAPPSTVANMHDLFGLPMPASLAPGTVVSVYPTQLMEVALGFAMFLIVWRLRDHEHGEGWLFGVYMVLAGIERFLIEFLRAKDDRFFGGITMAQLFSIVFIIAGVVWMQSRRARAGRAGIHAPAPQRV
ncbi:MAG: prolipoprotein diacylglyceryl transferase [Gemmatimonadaceae bacterium]